MLAEASMLFESDTLGWPLLAGLVGLCLGSLLNVVIHRLPLMLKQQDKQYAIDYARRFEPQLSINAEINPLPFNLFLPRSHCTQCKTPIAFYDNIPLVSWLILRQRCRHCQSLISWRYPLTEMTMMLTAFSLACYFPPGNQWLLLSAFSALLITLAAIDYDCQLLPDNLTYSLLWLGLIWHCLNDSHFLPAAIIGAIAGYMTLWLIYWGVKLLTTREGLGYGDFKLLAALGAWFGWQNLAEILLIAASVTLLALLPHRRSAPQAWLRPLPFGPGLAVAGFWMMISSLIGS